MTLKKAAQSTLFFESATSSPSPAQHQTDATLGPKELASARRTCGWNSKLQNQFGFPWTYLQIAVHKQLTFLWRCEMCALSDLGLAYCLVDQLFTHFLDIKNHSTSPWGQDFVFHFRFDQKAGQTMAWLWLHWQMTNVRKSVPINKPRNI